MIVHNVEKYGSSTKLDFGNGLVNFSHHIVDIQVNNNALLLIDSNNVKYEIDYTDPLLDKQGTLTPLALVEYWETNNFFFEKLKIDSYTVQTDANGLATIHLTDDGLVTGNPLYNEIKYVDAEPILDTTDPTLAPFKSAKRVFNNGNSFEWNILKGTTVILASPSLALVASGIDVNIIVFAY